MLLAKGCIKNPALRIYLVNGNACCCFFCYSFKFDIGPTCEPWTQLSEWPKSNILFQLSLSQLEPLYRLTLPLQRLSIDCISIRMHSTWPAGPRSTKWSCVLNVSWWEVSTCISLKHDEQQNKIKSQTCVWLGTTKGVPTSINRIEQLL